MSHQDGQNLTPEELQKKFNDLLYLFKTSIEKLDTTKSADVKAIYKQVAREAGEELLKMSQDS